jgi:hypothetical protein
MTLTLPRFRYQPSPFPSYYQRIFRWWAFVTFTILKSTAPEKLVGEGQSRLPSP